MALLWWRIQRRTITRCQTLIVKCTGIPSMARIRSRFSRHNKSSCCRMKCEQLTLMMKNECSRISRRKKSTCCVCLVEYLSARSCIGLKSSSIKNWVQWNRKWKKSPMNKNYSVLVWNSSTNEEKRTDSTIMKSMLLIAHLPTVVLQAK